MKIKKLLLKLLIILIGAGNLTNNLKAAETKELVEIVALPVAGVAALTALITSAIRKYYFSKAVIDLKEQYKNSYLPIIRDEIQLLNPQATEEQISNYINKYAIAENDFVNLITSKTTTDYANNIKQIARKMDIPIHQVYEELVHLDLIPKIKKYDNFVLEYFFGNRTDNEIKKEIITNLKISPNGMQEIGLKARQLKEIGFTPKELKDQFKFTGKDFADLNFQLEDFVTEKIKQPKELVNIIIKDYGFKGPELKRFGVTADNLINQEFNSRKLLENYNFKATDLDVLGFKTETIFRDFNLNTLDSSALRSTIEKLVKNYGFDTYHLTKFDVMRGPGEVRILDIAKPYLHGI